VAARADLSRPTPIRNLLSRLWNGSHLPAGNWRHTASTGWREPISISGQGKVAQASYSAGGLVFLAKPVDPGRASRPADLL